MAIWAENAANFFSHIFGRMMSPSGVRKRKKTITSINSGEFAKLDDRQITHLISVRLKSFLYDFFGGVWGLGSFSYIKGPKHP